MADSLHKDRFYRTMPRQGMTRWSVIKDVGGRAIVVANFHGYQQARAACDRLNGEAEAEIHAETRVKVLA